MFTDGKFTQVDREMFLTFEVDFAWKEHDVAIESSDLFPFELGFAGFGGEFKKTSVAA